MVFAGRAHHYLLPGDTRDGGDQLSALEDADGVFAQVGGDDLAGMTAAELDTLSGDHEAAGSADGPLGDLLGGRRKLRRRSGWTAALQTAARNCQDLWMRSGWLLAGEGA